jgi:hypothetical protein
MESVATADHSDWRRETEREHLARGVAPLYLGAMPLTPRTPSGPEPFKPPYGLMGAGLIILLLIGGLLWWANDSAWNAQDACQNDGGRWVAGACEGAATTG